MGERGVHGVSPCGNVLCGPEWVGDLIVRAQVTPTGRGRQLSAVVPSSQDEDAQGI